MAMATRYEVPASPELLEVRRQLSQADEPLVELDACNFDFEVRLSERNLWIVASSSGEQPIALRAIFVASGVLAVHHLERKGGFVQLEATSEVGAYRVTAEVTARDGAAVLHAKTSFLPNHNLRLHAHPRDLFFLDDRAENPQTSARLYTAQQGFQTGSLFAACAGTGGYSIFYFQNFTALRMYFEDTRTTPKDSVGGSLPEIGFRLPISEEHPLLASNEYTLSDSYVVLRRGAPTSEGEAARCYLDALALVAGDLEQLPRTYHDWPQRARATVCHLALSPECSIDVDGQRYLAPYVNAKDKPPESMVQLTVLMALLEFEKWTGDTYALARELLDGLENFFEKNVGSMVRWLPGEPFGAREDEHQTHDAMDSWYLYHVLFNIARLAEAGSANAKELLRRSLPYAIRVAKRFAYRWPIFFSLQTLDPVQAEAHKGSGGENDVSGLYSLVMLHAYEIFDEPAYLEEARQAADAMEGFGFGLSYQANTTGFAAEAALRLWKITKEQRYYDLTMVAIANIFDNISLWEPGYGNARWYSTYFGLYPLRGAPYIAAYEETEALAKFHEFLRLGGTDIPESVVLLIAEYGKWLLSRAWQYYPSELPQEALAAKSRNGCVRRELAIPLEDLQDGLTQSGQVGQEIYGAGLALVCTTRHFHRLQDRPFTLFSEYPLERISKSRFRVVGSSRMRCSVRLIPESANNPVSEDAASILGAKRRKGNRSIEGHLVLEARGGDVVVLKPGPRRRDR